MVIFYSYVGLSEGRSHPAFWLEQNLHPKDPMDPEAQICWLNPLGRGSFPVGRLCEVSFGQRRQGLLDADFFGMGVTFTVKMYICIMYILRYIYINMYQNIYIISYLHICNMMYIIYKLF